MNVCIESMHCIRSNERTPIAIRDGKKSTELRKKIVIVSLSRNFQSVSCKCACVYAHARWCVCLSIWSYTSVWIEVIHSYFYSGCTCVCVRTNRTIVYETGHTHEHIFFNQVCCSHVFSLFFANIVWSRVPPLPKLHNQMNLCLKIPPQLWIEINF